MGRWPRTGRFPVAMILVGAMVATAVALAALVVYDEVSLARIRPETQRLLTQGLPRIRAITEARAALRKVEGAANERIELLLEGNPDGLVATATARRAFATKLDTFRRLPAYPDEGSALAKIDLAVRAFESQIDGLAATLLSGNLKAAARRVRRQLRSATDQVDAELSNLIQMDAAHVVAHAARIDSVERIATRGALLLGVVDFLVTLIGGVTVVVVFWRHERFVQARQDELEFFSARVAHDVVSPMQAAFLALKRAKSCGDAQVETMAEKGIAALGRSRQVVDDLFQFARAGAQPDRTARADVGATLGALLEELRPQAEAERIELSLETIPPCEVACPAGVLGLCVANLVHNAIKYMGVRDLRRVAIGVRVQARTVAIRVDDTGPGLPDGIGDEIFQPYWRASKLPGLGLGLATVQRLVTAYGGRVGVSPRAGGGVRVWFELPRA